MGIFEKARNITDTDLRILLEKASEPSDALRRHILSLEESQRQLRSSRNFLEKQRTWLENSAERKLGLAEEWESRAMTAARQDRDDLARHALIRKKELLLSMSEDRRQLERILPQLTQTEGQAREVRKKILKAKALRSRLFEDGKVGTLTDDDVAELESEDDSPTTTDRAERSQFDEQELDNELEDLKRRLSSEGD